MQPQVPPASLLTGSVAPAAPSRLLLQNVRDTFFFYFELAWLSRMMPQSHILGTLSLPVSA